MRDVHVLPFQDHRDGWDNPNALDKLRLSLATTDAQVCALEQSVLATSGTFENSTVIVAPGRQVHLIFSGTQQHAEAQA